MSQVSFYFYKSNVFIVSMFSRHKQSSTGGNKGTNSLELFSDTSQEFNNSQAPLNSDSKNNE